MISQPGLLPAGVAGGLKRALAEGTRYVILDGTLISSDRSREKTTGSRHKQEIEASYEPAGHGVCTPVKKPRGGPELDVSSQAATYCSARRARLAHRSARPRRRRSTEQV
jgi:hypothetical protein